MEEKTFIQSLRDLINSYSIENGSNTPDFILADYMRNCLENFEKSVNRREEWYGRKNEMGMSDLSE